MNWALITAFLTIFFGIPSYLALRKKYTNQLFYIEENFIGLYNNIVKSFDNIEIKYKGNDVKENLFLLRGFILYLGHTDVTKNLISYPISVKLLDNSKIHECKILQTTQGLNPNISMVSEAEVKFETDLIKNEDYMYFEILGEEISSKSNNIYDINHRIANVLPFRFIRTNSFQTWKNLLYATIFANLFGFSTMMLIIRQPFYLQPNDFKQHVLYKNNVISSKVKDSILSNSTNIFDTVQKNYNHFSFIFRNKTKAYIISKDYKMYFTYIKKRELFSFSFILIVQLFAFCVLIFVFNTFLVYRKVNRKYLFTKKSAFSV